MRLATVADGSPDGTLIVVSTDGARALPAREAASTLQQALEGWPSIEVRLRELEDRVDRGEGEPLDHARLLAPLPRAWQWLDGSAFPQHGDLMQKAFGLPPLGRDRPLMYQGMSHRFLSASEDVPLPSEDDGIDFEGEFGVVTDNVPMGISAQAALDRVRLIVLINDWSLRTLAPIEMKTGFGWVQAKPACSIAPFAVTPDGLGPAWADGRVHLPLEVSVNGSWFGHPNGGEMEFGFGDLIAHAVRTRDLPAGTIIGSGTVSNASYATDGSTCIAERRAVEAIEHSAPRTDFMRFGDTVRMRAVAPGGSPFGEIRQRVVPAGRPTA